MKDGPFIDSETILRLREFARAMKDHDGGGLPMAELVDLANRVRVEAGVTIDVAASRELGEPMIIVQLPESRKPSRLLDALSPREREVAELVADGKSNKEIAAALSISVATVKDHVHNILEKTGLSRRSELIAAHHRSGLVGNPS